MRSICHIIIVLVSTWLAGCETARHVENPIFTGSPVVSSLRPEIGALNSLGTPPPPNFRTLRLAIRDESKGTYLGDMHITLNSSSNAYGETSEKSSYTVFDGKCTVLRDIHSVELGGFLTLMQTAMVSSNDCKRWGVGYDRRELVQVRDVQGQLFPLQVGRKASLTFVTLVSNSRNDTGKSETEEISKATFEVMQRIPDYHIESAGRNLGEVYVIRLTGSTGRESLSQELLFSTRLGWRIGYSTGIQAALVDWSE